MAFALNAFLCGADALCFGLFFTAMFVVVVVVSLFVATMNLLPMMKNAKRN